MRPKEGWATTRTKYFEQNQSLNRWGKTRQKDYEAGADALLAVLIDEGVIYYGQLDWLVNKSEMSELS